MRCGKILHTPKGIVYYVGTSVGLYSTTLLNGLQTVWTKEGTTTIGTIIVDAIDARQNDGRVIVSTQGGGVFINTPSSGVTGKSFTVTHAFQLEQNYPNPFAGSSQIRFTVSTRSEVTIEMYNTLGVKLSTLASGFFDIGSHIIALSSMGLAKGNYFVRATLGNTIITKMITVFP